MSHLHGWLMFCQIVSWDILRLCIFALPSVGQQANGAEGKQGEGGGFGHIISVVLVAYRAGHFANSVSRIAEQLLGLGQSNFFQELVEDLVHLKAGAEVGGATLPDEPPALVGQGQGWLPTTLQAAPTADVGVGLPAFRTRSLARSRAQNGYFTGSLEVHWAMPQDVEAQAGQLGNNSEHRPGQPCSQQVLTLLEGEKLRRFGLCHRF